MQDPVHYKWSTPDGLVIGVAKTQPSVGRGRYYLFTERRALKTGRVKVAWFTSRKRAIGYATAMSDMLYNGTTETRSDDHHG